VEQRCEESKEQLPFVAVGTADPFFFLYSCLSLCSSSLLAPQPAQHPCWVIVPDRLNLRRRMLPVRLLWGHPASIRFMFGEGTCSQLCLSCFNVLRQILYHQFLMPRGSWALQQLLRGHPHCCSLRDLQLVILPEFWAHKHLECWV
jgi:hypothetical protein